MEVRPLVLRAGPRRMLAVALLVAALLAMSAVSSPGSSLLAPGEAHAIGKDQNVCSYTQGYIPGSPALCNYNTYQGAECTVEVPVLFFNYAGLGCNQAYGGIRAGNDHAVQGYVDMVTAQGVWGWCRDLDYLGAANVDVWVNDAYRATAPCNGYRPDLPAGLPGDPLGGNRAYYLPIGLNPGDKVEVYGLGLWNTGVETRTDPWLRYSANGWQTEVYVPPVIFYGASAQGVVQAESAQLSAGVTVARNHRGYAGSGFLDFPNDGGGNAQVTVPATRNGKHWLTVRYANGSADARLLRFKVNQGEGAKVLLPSTGSWDSWNVVTLPVNLNQGNNAVRLLGAAASPTANIDSLRVSTR